MEQDEKQDFQDAMDAVVSYLETLNIKAETSENGVTLKPIDVLRILHRKV